MLSPRRADGLHATINIQWPQGWSHYRNETTNAEVPPEPGPILDPSSQMLQDRRQAGLPLKASAMHQGERLRLSPVATQRLSAVSSTSEYTTNVLPGSLNTSPCPTNTAARSPPTNPSARRPAVVDPYRRASPRAYVRAARGSPRLLPSLPLLKLLRHRRSSVRPGPPEARALADRPADATRPPPVRRPRRAPRARRRLAAAVVSAEANLKQANTVSARSSRWARPCLPLFSLWSALPSARPSAKAGS